jgi:hypothetical protein
MKVFLPIIFLFFGNICAFPFNPKSTEKEFNRYKVQPVFASPSINADWNKKIWKDTQPIELKNYMGDKPEHFPDVQVKSRYDEKNIYVIFQVKDQYVKAIAKEIHGRVWEDSCVEFFFCPGPDISKGYFNLETNCKGVFLLGYTKNSNGDRGLVDLEDCKKITIAHSLKMNAETEIMKPITWYIEYAIPLEMITKYIKIDHPAKGVQWRANFFKCADKTSHPHWLTWNQVVNPVPKFHMPEYFGILEFQ